MLLFRPSTRLPSILQSRTPVHPRTFASNIRTMAAAAAPAKQEWLIILPDHAGALEQRMKVRPYVYALPPQPFAHQLTGLVCRS